MYIFQNPGSIDPILIRTFAASVKEKENPIGKFGTGLKYAIARILATQGTLRIVTDDNDLHFSTKRVEIRNKEFNLVCMNGEELGFTTELGSHWEPWMVFRELACNALDENGEYFWSHESNFLHSPGTTAVIVTGSLMRQAWGSRAETIITNPPPGEVLATPSKHIYLNGVRVFTPELPTRLTYNLLTAELTEDRTLQNPYGVCQHTFSQIIAKCNNKEIIEAALSCSEQEYVEGSLLFGYVGTPSPEFLATVRTMRKNGTLKCNGAAKFARTNTDIFNESTPVINLDPYKRTMHLKAFEIASGMLGINAEFDIRYSNELPPTMLGFVVDANSNKVIISEQCFDLGLNMLAGTIFEEMVHIVKGFKDETRGFQNYLINALVGLYCRHKEII